MRSALEVAVSHLAIKAPQFHCEIVPLMINCADENFIYSQQSMMKILFYPNRKIISQQGYNMPMQMNDLNAFSKKAASGLVM